MPHSSSLGQVLAKLRADPPLVQCITNYVSMDFMANCLLAVGASPAMVHSSDEVDDFAALASALNINIGTISQAWFVAMLSAARAMHRLGKPCVLDPVGIGATKFRQDACKTILNTGTISLIRANASEIIACANLFDPNAAESKQLGRGVDSLDPAESALPAAQTVNRATGAIVIISGVSDYVVTKESHWRVDGGHEYLVKVTASGCSLNALLAACLAVHPEDHLQASLTGLSIFALCAQQAAQSAAGPGSFRANFIDALHNLGEQQLSSMANIVEITGN